MQLIIMTPCLPAHDDPNLQGAIHMIFSLYVALR